MCNIENCRQCEYNAHEEQNKVMGKVGIMMIIIIFGLAFILL